MDLLVVTPAQRQQIHKILGVNEREIRQDVDIIKTWKSKQPHLPKNITDDFIEKLLLKNKFRVEQTKQKLENYYTLRGQNLDFIQSLQDVRPSKSIVSYFPLPNLTPNFERVIIWRNNSTDENYFDTMEVVKIQFAINELRLKYDYSIGVRIIVDCKGFTLKQVASVNPLLLTKSASLQEKAFSDRILGLEFVNFPSFAGKAMAIMKLILKPKIYDRITIHETLKSLQAAIPKENLPADYGGLLDQTVDLEKQWDEIMKQHHDFFVQNYNNVAVESLRLQENKPNQEFGVDGTFKKLAID